jgi:dUTP pyrophosphatase
MLIPIVDIKKVKTPNRAHPTDAGMDFYCPQINDKLVEDMKNNIANNGIQYEKEKGMLIIPPGVNAVIPSGIKVEIPYGYMGLFLNKSGVASKKDLIIGAQVIDTFYSGEVHIDLHNVGKNEIIIESDMKLAQMVLTSVIYPEPTYADESMLYSDMRLESERGEGGFGSTNEK